MNSAGSDWQAKVIELAKKGVSLLRINEDQWGELRQGLARGLRFSLVFPHEVASKAKPGTLALISIDDSDIRVGIVSSKSAVATLESRVLFDLVQPVIPSSLSELSEAIIKTNPRLNVSRLSASQESLIPLPMGLRTCALAALTTEPANEAAFNPILNRLDSPRRFDGNRALELDAINIALKAFGLTNGATSVSVAGKGSSLETTRVLEDAVIEHDARWMPGWNLSDSDLTGRAIFERRNERLVVYTANKRPLEALLGVDLLYLNEDRQSLVMVQYKMMEPSMIAAGVGHGAADDVMNESEDRDDATENERKEWTSLIDGQFMDEMLRMSKFDSDLSPQGAYRLNSTGFYFKFVRRNAPTSSSSLILSLGHIEKILADGVDKGPRGGSRISYESLSGHYLRGDCFVELIRSGYIGTRDSTTFHLQNLIDQTLKNHRGVVAAIQTAIK